MLFNALYIRWIHVKIFFDFFSPKLAKMPFLWFCIIFRGGENIGLLRLFCRYFAVFCHAKRSRSIYGIAQQSSVSTLWEILHFIQNDRGLRGARSRTMTADTDFAIVPLVSMVPIVSKKITRDERDPRDEREVSDNDRWYRLRYCPFCLYRPYRLKKSIRSLRLCRGWLSYF